MPFSVTPESGVDIDGRDLTVDDFLELKMSDGEVIYIRNAYTGPLGFGRFREFVLDLDFLPEGFMSSVESSALYWMDTVYPSLSERQRRRFEDSCRSRQASPIIDRKSMAADLAARLLDTNRLYARYYKTIDIGERVSVYYSSISSQGWMKKSPHGEDMTFWSKEQAQKEFSYWSPVSTILSITPITRSEILARTSTEEKP